MYPGINIVIKSNTDFILGISLLRSLQHVRRANICQTDNNSSK